MPYHGMDLWNGYHMTGWFPFMGFWMFGIWLIFIAIAYLVYKDAERRGMNSLLWAVLVALPWIGIIFLLAYLVVREEMAPKKTSMEILDERYARGDLSREDYMRMKEDLEK